MRYTYAYKTSDGIRHEDSMDAPSREAVFIALRERGVKAIKVVATDGSKANGEIVGVRKRVLASSVVIAALVAGAMVFLFDKGVDRGNAKPESAELVALREKAAAVTERHRANMTLAADDEAKKARAVETARKEAREIFQNILTVLPDERERQIAKSLYGELMIQVDISASK